MEKGKGAEGFERKRSVEREAEDGKWALIEQRWGRGAAKAGALGHKG